MFANISAAFSLLGDYTKNFAWFPESASTFSEDIDFVFGFISTVCLIFFVGVVGALFYFAIKYHKPKGEKAESNVAHHTVLEIFWSVGPSFLLVGMFVFGAKSFLDMRTVPDGANELDITAQKWSWSVHYGRGTFHPELHLLVNEPTKLSMLSNDVLHALYVPAFRAKRDIVPGRYNYMWFEPTIANKKVSEEELVKATQENAGKVWDYDRWQFTPDGYEFYDLYCAEYCGTDHSQMQTVVVVHETLDDLNAWIKEYSRRQADQTPAQYGELLYQRRGCMGCHSVDGSKRVGPSFKETFGNQRAFASGDQIAADENYIRESVIDPKAKVVNGFNPSMPSYKGQLSEDDLFCIIEFLKSVSDHAPTSASESQPDQADGEAAEPDGQENEPNGPEDD